jgi:hypothetical protein
VDLNDISAGNPLVQTKSSERPKLINLKAPLGKLIPKKEVIIEEEEEINSEAKTGAENKMIFIKKFGITVDLPALYVQDAKFSKSDPSYCLQLVNYVLPQSDVCDIQTHCVNGKKET